MAEFRDEAVKVANRLHQEDRIDYGEYTALMDGLGEVDTLRERDEALEELWGQFADIPMNEETECIEEPFLGFPAGTGREEIWHWFDERHSKGVAYLLYGGTEDYVPESKRLYGLSKLCFGCESKDCQFNHDGECRFAMVHELKPSISEHRGCLSYEYRGGELF